MNVITNYGILYQFAQRTLDRQKEKALRLFYDTELIIAENLIIVDSILSSQNCKRKMFYKLIFYVINVTVMKSLFY